MKGIGLMENLMDMGLRHGLVEAATGVNTGVVCEKGMVFIGSIQGMCTLESGPRGKAMVVVFRHV